MAIAMIAMLTFGATFALFTAASNVTTGTVNTGKISVSTTGNLTFASSRVFPGQNLTTGSISVTPNTAESADTAGEYVACKFTMTANNGSLNFTDSELAVTWDTTAGKWISAGNGVYVYAGSSATATTDPAQAISAATTAITNIAFNVDDLWMEGESASEKGWMDVPVAVSIEFRAVQATANANQTVGDIATYLFTTIESDVATARTPAQQGG